MIRNITSILSSNIISKLILVGSMPVITRLYEPEVFGVSVIIMSVSGILVAFASLRFDNAIVLSKHDVVSYSLVKLSLSILFSFVVLLSIVMVFFVSEISQLLSIREENSYLLYLVPVIVLSVGLNNIFLGLAQYFKKFGKFGLSEVLKALVNTSVKIILGLTFIATPLFLILGPIIGSTASVLYLYNVCFSHLKKRSSIKYLKYCVGKYKQFPYYDAPSAFLNRVNHSIPIVLTSVFFSNELSGMYSLAYTTLFLPVSLVSMAVKKVVIKEMSDNYNKKNSNMALIKKTTLSLFVISVIPFSVLHFFSSDLFIFAFGDKWGSAGDIAQYMVPWLVLLMIDTALHSVYTVYEKQKIKLIQQTGFFVIKVFVFVYMAFSGERGILVIETFLYLNFVLHLLSMAIAYSIAKKNI